MRFGQAPGAGGQPLAGAEPGSSRGPPSLQITTQEAPAGANRPPSGSGDRAGSSGPEPFGEDGTLGLWLCVLKNSFSQRSSGSGVERSASGIGGSKDKGEAVSAGWFHTALGDLPQLQRNDSAAAPLIGFHLLKFHFWKPNGGLSFRR